VLMYNRAIDLTRSSQRMRNTPAVSAPRTRVVEPKHPAISTLALDRLLAYRLTPHHAGWIGVDVLVGTHQRAATGIIVLSVLSSAGAILRETSVDLTRARDNAWLRFRFEPVDGIAEQPVFIKFSLLNAGAQTQISLYDTAPPQPRLERWIACWLRRVGWADARNSLYCRMWYMV